MALGSSQTEWVGKCLSAIELICEKDPLLLNRESEDKNMVIYKWILNSLIPLLSTDDLTLVTSVKQTVITMIHLITAKLRLFNYKRDIRTFFLTTFDSYLANLFKTSVPDKLINLLSISTNLLSILTDQEVRGKMMIESYYDQNFESSARKLDYIISSLSQSIINEQVDIIRSHLITSMLNYAINGDYIQYSRLKLFLGLCYETIQSPALPSHPSTQYTLSFVLLRTLQMSRNQEPNSFQKWVVI